MRHSVKKRVFQVNEGMPVIRGFLVLCLLVVVHGRYVDVEKVEDPSGFPFLVALVSAITLASFIWPVLRRVTVGDEELTMEYSFTHKVYSFQEYAFRTLASPRNDEIHVSDNSVLLDIQKDCRIVKRLELLLQPDESAEFASGMEGKGRPWQKDSGDRRVFRSFRTHMVTAFLVALLIAFPWLIMLAIPEPSLKEKFLYAFPALFYALLLFGLFVQPFPPVGTRRPAHSVTHITADSGKLRIKCLGVKEFTARAADCSVLTEFIWSPKVHWKKRGKRGRASWQDLLKVNGTSYHLAFPPQAVYQLEATVEKMKREAARYKVE